jgi:hypothetical protein
MIRGRAARRLPWLALGGFLGCIVAIAWWQDLSRPLLLSLVAATGLAGLMVYARRVRRRQAAYVALALEHDELVTLIRDERFEEGPSTGTSRRSRW